MTVPHIKKQLEYLTAIDAGKRMKWRSRFIFEGKPCLWHPWVPSRSGHPAWNRDEDYEICEDAPQQYIPECDVPRAMEVEPEIGSMYWGISTMSSPPVRRYLWEGDSCDENMFANGCCFATESEARAAWDAMTARREE